MIGSMDGNAQTVDGEASDEELAEFVRLIQADYARIPILGILNAPFSFAGSVTRPRTIGANLRFSLD